MATEEEIKRLEKATELANRRLQNQRQLIAEMAKAETEAYRVAENLKDIEEEITLLQEAKTEGYQQQVAAKQAELAQIRASNIALDAKINKIKELLDLEAELYEDVRKRNEEQRKAEEERNERLQAAQDLLQGALSIGQRITGLDLAGYIQSPVSTLTDQFFELLTAQDEAMVAVGKMSAGMRQFGGGVKAAQMENAALGATMEEMAQIQVGLIQGFADAQYQTETNQKALQKLALESERLGVATAETAGKMDMLTRGMGLTFEAAMASAEGLRDFAGEIGYAPQELAQEFNSLGGELAKYGAEGEDAFKGLAKTARSLGMAVTEAFKIAELFDTFSSAAETVGLLNAQLGIGLNAVELMTAKEEERIHILRAQFAQQGRNFGDMHRREQQAVARMLGIDVSMARRLFGTKQEFDEAQKSMADTEARTKAMTTVTQQFQSILQAIAPDMEAMVGYIKEWVGFFKENTWILKMIVATSVFGGVIGIVGKTVMGLAMTIAMFLPISSTFATNMALLGMAARQAAPGMLAFGAAVLMIGAGLALALSQFSQMTSDQIFATTVALGLLGIGLLATAFIVAKMAPVFVIAGAALTAFGTGLLYIGAATALVSLTLPGLVDPIVALAEQGSNLFLVAGGLAAIGAALVALSAGGLTAAVGNLFTNILSFGQDDPLDKLINFARDISETNVDPAAIDAIANVMVSTERIMAAAPDLTDESVQRVRQLIDSAVSIKEIGTVQTAASIVALNELMKSNGTSTPRQTQQKPFNIYVQIDGEDAARVLYPEIEKIMTKKMS